MKNRQVIHYKNLSRKSPIISTLIFILFVKEFHILNSTIGAVVVGAVGCLIIVLWVLFIIDLIFVKEKPSHVEFKPDERTADNSSKIPGARV